MFFRTAAAFAAALSISIAPAGAHEGHDHGEGAASAAPAAAPAASARADAVGTAVELVAVAEGTSLLLYLDAFATNEPLADADITVETPAGPVKASADGDRYRLDAPFLAKPGRYELIATIAAGSDLEILPLTLVTTAPAAPALSIGSTVSLVSSVVTASTQAPGQRDVISPVASMPPMTGICTSIITMSGCSRSNSEIASTPFSASATTVISGARETKCLSAIRTNGSSSVINTRISLMYRF